MFYVDNKQQWSWTLKDTKDKDLYISMYTCKEEPVKRNL